MIPSTKRNYKKTKRGNLQIKRYLRDIINYNV